MSDRFDSIRNVKQNIASIAGPGRLRSVQITGASCLGNLFVGSGKLAMGIMSLSFFTCISAFYTFGMVIAKACALWGMAVDNNLEKQYRYYRLSGIILIIASILYVIYSTRLLWQPDTSCYDKYTGITIAAFTFAELGLNIRGVIIEHKKRALLFHAIKMINLASSMICLVLTQTALLSFTASDTAYDHSGFNGLMGMIMGMAATMTGCAMLKHIHKVRLKQETEEMI